MQTRTWLERIIPNRLNRSLWGLLAGLGYAIILTGPLVAVFIYDAIYDVPLIPTLLTLWGTNLAAFTLALIAGTILLSRLREPLTGARAVLFAVGLTLLGAVLRAAIFIPITEGQMPERQGAFVAVQFLLALIFLAAMTAGVIYASARERVLEDTFRDLARVNASLTHEEEAVRSEVFDQLHGSLQAEFVAVRRRLADLARETTDPRAADTARDLDGTLDRLYRDGVGAVARALNPPGLEVGLHTALAELAERLDQATDLRVEFDPVAAALDDPMAGGLHRGVRIASYRIIEEAVSNAMRHSGARVVDVQVYSSLDQGQAMLAMRVSHEVEGEITVREGSGLSRMRSRAQALGGTVSFTVGTGQFMIAAAIPLALPDGGRWADAEPLRTSGP